MKHDERPADRPELEARVAAHPFLVGMKPRQINLLIDCALLTHFQAGQTIFRTGDTANRFYLIESGSVALEAVSLGEAPVLIDTVKAGDLLGWSWLFPPTAGISTRAQSRRPPRSSFMEQSCGNTASAIRFSVTSFSSE